MCNCGQTVDDETYMRNLANTFAMIRNSEKPKVGYYIDEGDTRTHVFPDEEKN